MQRCETSMSDNVAVRLCDTPASLYCIETSTSSPSITALKGLYYVMVGADYIQHVAIWSA